MVNVSTVYHGLAMSIKLSGDKNLFDGFPEELEVGRYHSWVVDDKNFPAELEITAKDANGFIMALQHKTYDVRGVQFHPDPFGDREVQDVEEG